jgi:hypothetical protein
VLDAVPPFDGAPPVVDVLEPAVEVEAEPAVLVTVPPALLLALPGSSVPPHAQTLIGTKSATPRQASFRIVWIMQRATVSIPSAAHSFCEGKIQGLPHPTG